MSADKTLDLASIRAPARRHLRGRQFWRSLEELAETPEFRELAAARVPAAGVGVARPGRPPRLPEADGRVARPGRRDRCTRQPDEQIVPYVRQPENVVPGQAALLRDGDAARRLRHRRARREPRGPADQDRGQPGSPGEPRRDRRLRAGLGPARSTTPTARRPSLPRRRSVTWGEFVAAIARRAQPARRPRRARACGS